MNETLAKKINELIDLVLLMPEISETMPLAKVIENAEKIRNAKYAIARACQGILKESRNAERYRAD